MDTQKPHPVPTSQSHRDVAQPSLVEDGLDVVEHCTNVQARIRSIAMAANRSPSEVLLVAVSKYATQQHVDQLRASGFLDFGESQVQSLEKRMRAEQATTRWHFIGRLQTNKVAKIVGKVSTIHSVDSLRLATEIAKRAASLRDVQRAFLQVNVDDDPNKAGVPLEEAMSVIGKIRRLQGISIQGLSTIPSQDGDPRQAFRRLKELRDTIRAQWPEVLHLSMGMSNDYEIAIQEGATHVRVGSSIFGTNP